MTEAPASVIAIGIDAASPELIDRWTRDGTLPHLRSLVDRGISGRIGGVEGFFVGSTWPTMYTGTNPARHGVHYQLQIVPGSYDLHWVAEGSFVHGEPLWRSLSRQGRRVAVLDVPLSRPEEVNGLQVVEWGGHDALFGFRTRPDALAEELVARFGTHPQPTNCDADRRRAADYLDFLDRLEVGIARKTRWTIDLLHRERWDLFMQVFTEAHCTGHQCWHLHDASHPAHDATIAAETGDPLRRIYRAIDRAIGEIVAHAGDAPIVVFSAHGMSYWYGAQFLLPGILERLGVTQPLPAQESREGAAERGARAVWQRLPAIMQRPVRRVRDQIMRGRNESTASVTPRIPADTARSLCFPLNNGQAVGGIRLNLVGREPEGRLEPGAEADAFCERLRRDLLEIVDDRTDSPLVRRVLRTSAMYNGERLDDLPDLLVEWSDQVPTGTSALGGGAAARVRARSPKIGVIEGENSYGRTGEHRPGGWFATAGRGIRASMLSREVPLESLAPALARLAGGAMRDTDCSPAPELLRSS